MSLFKKEIRDESEDTPRVCDKCMCYFKPYPNCIVKTWVDRVRPPLLVSNYCLSCHPPYDESYIGDPIIYYKNIPAHKIEVDESGNPIKEKKKK